ncbi:MAG: hypothetical protein LBD90_08815, partial [Bifidobacteriaceae bacterium]|nr:hypothetical protein [Bifidobacteriaceae bacterium]
MTTAREAPQELLRLACAPGPLLERCQFAETAAALASQTSDDDLGYRARMWLTDLAFTAGAEDCMIASFDWCRAKNAADPARFPAELEAGPALVWQFQRVLKVFGESAHHPVEAGEELLADLAHHCAVAGLAEGVVVAAAFRHAWATGQLERARALAEAFAALPPTKRGGGSGLPAWELAVFA